MDRAAAHDAYLQQLRQWRNRPEADRSLAFLGKQFQQQIARPHKQVAKVAAAWQALIPAELVEQTALVSLRSGVLTVQVADNAAHFQLGRLLRSGLERQLKSSCGAALRRVRCQVGPIG